MKKLCFLIFILIFTTACFSSEGIIDGVSSKTKLTGTSGNQVDVTSSNNIQASINEFGSSVSSNSNSQLNVTNYMTDGTQGACIRDCGNTSFSWGMSANNIGRVAMATRLIGVAFVGVAKETKFWAESVTGSGTQISIIDTAKALGTLTFDAPYSNGLTIVTSGGAKITVVYE